METKANIESMTLGEGKWLLHSVDRWPGNGKYGGDILYIEDMGHFEVKEAKASGVVHVVKLYPAGATTNSDA